MKHTVSKRFKNLDQDKLLNVLKKASQAGDVVKSSNHEASIGREPTCRWDQWGRTG